MPCQAIKTNQSNIFVWVLGEDTSILRATTAQIARRYRILARFCADLVTIHRVHKPR